MTKFAQGNDGVRIAYEEAGSGAPILLVHGFASDRVQNWRAPGWYDTLTRAGRRVIAMDCRGHGESDKPHDVDAYDHATMAGDAIAVLDEADVAACPIMGYSMGGYIGMHLLMVRAPRVTSLIMAASAVPISIPNRCRAPSRTARTGP